MIKVNFTLVIAFTAANLFSLGNVEAQSSLAKEIKFKKHVITNEFISEGSAVGDINKDGKLDIIAGAYWFEAPTWKQHEIAKAIKKYDWKVEYSNSFLNHAMDINQDGWIDVIRIDFPGEAAVWYENPKGKEELWKEHPLYASVGNESPRFVDMDGDGKIDLLCNDSKGNRMIWLESPKKKGVLEWTVHVISDVKDRATHQFTHGLGYADMNKDGKPDVITRTGWWEGPANIQAEGNWTWHPADLGEDCSQMYAMDLDKDGDVDVISASAHNFGIWWHEQVIDSQGDVTWKHHEILKTFSQTHGLGLVDMNRDGNPDLVTGKRFFAHHGHDPGEYDPAVLYWFEYKPGKTPTWIPHEIDNDSGNGLQTNAIDMNKDKLVDIVVSNKKGVFFFEQIK